MRTLVVGAGIIGLSCAYELAKDGHDVTVVDHSPPGMGSTAGSAAKVALAETTPLPAPGMVLQGLKWMLHADFPLYVRPSFAPSFARFMFALARHCNTRDLRAGLGTYLQLASTCLAVFEQWQDEGIHFEEHRRGVLLAYRHEASLRHRLAQDDIFERFGYRSTLLDEQGIHALEPTLSDRIRRGFYYSADRQIEPLSLITSLAQALTRRGHTIRDDVTVHGFSHTNGAVTAALTDTDPLPCDAILLAAGAFTGTLVNQLGIRLPIAAGKGYSIDYPLPPTAVTTPMTLEDLHVAISPLADRTSGSGPQPGQDRVAGHQIRAPSVPSSGLSLNWSGG